jgi:putative oxidoreductase
LVAFGLFTRFAASSRVAKWPTAYFMTSFSGKVIGHAPTAMERFFPIRNKGELPVMFCFVFFFIIFYGPGRWSIDALIKGRARPLATAEPVQGGGGPGAQWA